MSDLPQGSQSAPVGLPDRLESWKEIAAHFNRTVRTVQRWEREQGLPVHRFQHNRLASVYAYKGELDAWWAERRTSLNAEDHENEDDVMAPTSGQRLSLGRRGRTTAVLAGAAALVAAVIGLAWINAEPRAPSRRVRSIAVLPLVNTASGVDPFVADGVADDLARLISRIKSVRVVARMPSSRAPSADTDDRQMAARLDVDAVLRGTVSGEASAIALDLALIDGDSGQTLWSSQFKGDLQGLAARSASTVLARDLFASVWPDEAPPQSTVRPTDAYLTYLRGRYHLAQRQPDAVREAERLFAEAIRLDPTYPEAHAGLADAWVVMAIFGQVDRRDGLSRAKATAEHALSLDPSSAEAHTSLAFTLELLDHRWAEAESHFRQAIALNPSYVPAHHWYSLLLDSELRADESIREMETALVLDPFSTLLASDLGMVLAHQRRYDRAIAQFAKVLAINPAYADAQMELGQAYMHAGRHDLAIKSFERARELGVDAHVVDVQEAISHALGGNAAEARQWVARMRRAGDERGLSAVLLALGEHDRALEMTLRERPDGDENLLIGRLFDPVRSHPAYLELLRRSGLDQVTGKAGPTH